MRKSFLLLMFIVFACAQNNQQSEVQKFGGEVTIAESTPIAQVIQDAEKYVGNEVRLTGTISEICQKKGCWLKMTDGQNELTIRFKDYAFFVPTDAVNSQVTVQGIFEVAMNDHIMQEANKNKSDSGNMEMANYSMTASAVEIVPAQPASEQQKL